MSRTNLETAMLTYLGGDPHSAEYDPFGGDERLQALCGGETDTIKAMLEKLLSAMWDSHLDTSMGDLPSIADSVTHWLAKQVPQFSEITRRKMASYFTFIIR